VTSVKSLLGLVGANEYHTEILILEVCVNVQHVLFRAARHADCGPVLAIRKIFDGPDVIEYYINVCK
jgi:hypothetical protein